MTTTSNFWVSCLVWLVGLSGWVSVVILLVNARKERLFTMNIRENTFIMNITMLVNRRVPLPIVCGLSVFMFVAGIATRDLWQFNHTVTLTGVTIDAINLQTGDFLYTADSIDGNVQQKGSRFCTDYIPAFHEVPLHLATLVYEDRGLCWSIANKRLGFIVDPKQRRKEISYGMYSAR